MNCIRFLKQSHQKIPKQYVRTLFGGKKKGKQYTDTLNLPKTDFPISMRDAVARECAIQEDCDFQGLYEWQKANNTGEEFILHDGPPYANGSPHVGHAINKILKDITNRYRVLRGHRVHYVPGWDCHGLPIELKAIKGHTSQKLTPLQIRDKARKFAQTAISAQMAGFQRWGVMANWNQCYYTFDPAYQAKQLDVFYEMYQKGLIYMDVMPVYWSPSSRTALAESELVYQSDHVSKAVYVHFPITHCTDVLQAHCDPESKLYSVIWTTTPWTLPANQAISYSDKIRYALLKDRTSKDVYICEESFAARLSDIVKKDLQILHSFQGNQLKGMKYWNPLTNEDLPLLMGDHVTADKGTGLVHTAPAHGHDDFHLAVKHKMDIKDYLDDKGMYTEDAGPDLCGRVIGKDAESTVLELLKEYVLHTEDFTHSYPYDWRTNKPVIIRASRQWFINTEKLKDRAVELLRDVEVQPASTETGMLNQLESRTYWCISRQRAWGVPIPVFYHKDTKEPLLNSATISHIRQLVSSKGSDCWWSLPHEELLPAELLREHGLGRTENYIRGEDILDIWFDSGTSWASVIGAGKQADVYMEGHDQFRGWFQSSLLTSLAVKDRAPYKKLVVHGFTMDEDGKKMSKSVGNVVDPDVVINGGKNKKLEPAYGADVLRWWAAFSCLQPHSTIGPSKLSRMLEDIYELRKTLRFLLGNISRDSSESLLDYDSLWPQDQYILHQLYQVAKSVQQFYAQYEYSKILQMVDKFCKDDVSRFYSTIIKDRCYCNASDDLTRQASLTVQYHVLHVLTKLLAPIIPHMAEELYQHFPPSRRKNDVNSVFKTGWFELPAQWDNLDLAHTLDPALDIRDHLQDIVQSEPTKEFDVIIYASHLLHNKLHELQAAHSSSSSPLCEILDTASVTLTDKPLDVNLEDVQAVDGICHVHMKDGFKCPEKYVLILTDTFKFQCPRCRRFAATNAKDPCTRCLDVMATGWQ